LKDRRQREQNGALQTARSVNYFVNQFTLGGEATAGSLVSAAHELFLEVSPMPVAPADEVAYEKLCQAADLWRRDGQHFSAGVAMLRAVDAAWGRPERMGEAQSVALVDFERVISEQAPDSPASLASLYKLRQALDRTLWLFEVDRTTIGNRIRELNSELAQRLLKHFGNSDHADNYLVRGFVIATDLNGVWTTRFPNYEVPLGTEQWGQELILNIPSAFHLLVADRDWQGAHEIARVRSSAFTMPGLKGWRAVTLAHVEPGKAIAWFDEAAESFAADALPVSDGERIARGGFWSGINQQLWAKYFHARARLIESIRTPTEVKELLDRAVKALKGTESGWHSGEVSRFRVLINVLAKLVSDPLSFSSEDARREYELEIRMSEETEEDRLALTFISEAANAFRGFESEPASELTRNRLALALDVLAKIPTIGPDVTSAVRPAIGKSALTAMLGPIRTWMHRSLAGITDEACFRRILLRLLQSGLPLYTQIRHGPIEYGKDIVALLEVDGSVVLRHYQVKCGDIDKKKWRESKDELEEMFLVPLNSFQLPVAPQRIEGVLVTNGHANPYVEPVIDGWLRSQRQDHGRIVEFMHLDGLVDWIVEHRRVNELKNALHEQGVEV